MDKELENESKESEKDKKSFPPLLKKKTKTTTYANVKRIKAAPDEGLSTAQVEKRKAQGLVNKVGKKYSKSYYRIFKDNL